MYVTALGVALLVIGATVVLVEAHVPSLGMLGVPGVVGIAAGSVLAVAGLGGGVVLGLVAAVVLAGAALGVVGLSVSKGAAVRRRYVRGGVIGHLGVVRRWSDPHRTVLVDGALWNACPSWPDDELCEGDRVVVERVSGLTLAVRKAEEWELVA